MNRQERRHLGSFGKKKEPLDADFEYFGHTIRVSPKLTNLAILGFMDLAEDIDDKDEVSAMKAIRDFLGLAIHPDDWKEFWEVSLEERQSMEDFMELQWKLLEVCSDRPLSPSSDSLPGQKATDPNSKDASFSRVMERLEGRPDLRNIVMTKKEIDRAKVASIN